MRAIVPSSWLRTSLLADAAASGLVGLLQVFAATWLSKHTNLPHGLVVGTGIFLLAYAGFLAYTARSTTVPWALIAGIIVGNMGWAVACMTLLTMDLFTPSGVGMLFLILQVFTVFSFAGLELAGLRASRDAVSEHPEVARA